MCGRLFLINPVTRFAPVGSSRIIEVSEFLRFCLHWDTEDIEIKCISYQMISIYPLKWVHFKVNAITDLAYNLICEISPV